MKWNDDWRTELKDSNENCYLRLCECCNRKFDILIIAGLMYKYNQYRTKEECLDRTIEWIIDWNSQVELYPSDSKEYQKILSRMQLTSDIQCDTV